MDIFDMITLKNRASLGDIATQAFKEKTIEVGVGKAFTNVTDAINSIVDNAYNKRYKIKVYSGTYAERIILKPYVGVCGVNRESVIFEWNRPNTIPDADVTSQSMVELHDDGCYIRNLTVKGQNFRYMVHTEFGTNSDKTVEIDNCYIEHNGNDVIYTWTNPHAWGVGLGVNNTKIKMENSRFIGASNGRGLLVHDNASPTGSSFVESDNSTFLSDGGSVYGAINLDNYASYTGSIPWYAKFNNNHIQDTINVTTNSNPQRCRITGGGNSMQTYYAADWIDSSAGYFIKNNSGATIVNGTAVMMSDNKREIASVMNGTSYSSYSRFLGFAIGDIPNGEYGRVCYKGSVTALFNSTSDYLNELMLDTNGQIIKYDIATAGRRMVIGQHIQAASATVGSYRNIELKDNIKNVLANNALTRGSNWTEGAPGGVPTATPNYKGEFYYDTVGLGIYIAKGLTSSDWVKIN